MVRGYARATLVSGCAALLTLLARPAWTQEVNCDPGDQEVTGLSFVGNTAFTDTELSRVIVTTPSPFARTVLRLPLTTRRCLDRAELPKDRARLVIFYRRSGFADAVVDTLLRPERGGVEVRFIINEGLPTLLGSLVIEGLDSVANRDVIVRNLPIRAGGRFDRVALEAARDTIGRRLRNSGYPRAVVDNSFDIDDERRIAHDTITVSTGPFTRIGNVEIEVVPFEGKSKQVPDRIVRSIVGLDSGDVYREDDLLEAQRSLYRTEAYQHVSLVPDTAIVGDSILDVRVLLAENTTRSARLGAGYGTLDCLRLTGELSNYNFLRSLRRLDLTTRLSKIGAGDPVSGFDAICPQARRDPFSSKLNYYVGATLRQPAFSGLRVIPTITLFSERVSEYNAYLRTTVIGGVASLEYRRWRGTPVTFAYSLDLGRTEAQPALFCAVFNLCDREDRRRVQQTQRLAVVSAAVSRDRTNNLVSPSRGYQFRVEARHASSFILSDTALQFNKLLAERSHYWGQPGGTVVAFRIRGGAVVGRTFGNVTGFIPPQERLYAGGPSSMRGFAQNELGSLVYIARSYELRVLPNGTDSILAIPDSAQDIRRAVPTGGNSLILGNLELRMPSPFLPDLLQWTLFADAGDVWTRGRRDRLQNFSIKVTPGVQVTALSPVGPVRLVVGYNPYDRPAGPLYYEVPGGTPTDELGSRAGTLPCLSLSADPNRQLKVHRADDGTLVQDEGICPSTFRPRTSRSFGSRLTFSLAIGQAF